MKIYYQNKAAKLKLGNLYATCERCPFKAGILCSFGLPTTINCQDKGWWVDGESPDIFKV